MGIQANARARIAVGFLVVLTYATDLGADESERRLDLKSATADVEELIKQRAALGERLIKVVADAEAPANDRIAAAQLLAKMQYSPAIPVLIRHVELRPRVSESTGPPVAGALAEFGEAALSSILDAYLAHENPNGLEIDRRELALLFALDGPMAARARIYIIGVAVSRLNAETDLGSTLKIHNILEFLDDLKRDSER